MIGAPTVIASSSAPSWGALAGAIAAVVVFHWLLPRVIFPRFAARRSRPSLVEDPTPSRWVITVGAGLSTYIAVGLILGIAASSLAIWGIAFLAGMAILYRRAGR